MLAERPAGRTCGIELRSRSRTALFEDAPLHHRPRVRRLLALQPFSQDSLGVRVHLVGLFRAGTGRNTFWIRTHGLILRLRNATSKKLKVLQCIRCVLAGVARAARASSDRLTPCEIEPLSRPENTTLSAIDVDGHSTVMLSLLISRKRALPLVWRSVPRKGIRRAIGTSTKMKGLPHFREVLPAGVWVGPSSLGRPGSAISAPVASSTVGAMGAMQHGTHGLYGTGGLVESTTYRIQRPRESANS
jgi:hypothetical protein